MHKKDIFIILVVCSLGTSVCVGIYIFRNHIFKNNPSSAKIEEKSRKVSPAMTRRINTEEEILNTTEFNEFDINSIDKTTLDAQHEITKEIELKKRLEESKRNIKGKSRDVSPEMTRQINPGEEILNTTEFNEFDINSIDKTTLDAQHEILKEIELKKRLEESKRDIKGKSRETSPEMTIQINPEEEILNPTEFNEFDINSIDKTTLDAQHEILKEIELKKHLEESKRDIPISEEEIKNKSSSLIEEGIEEGISSSEATHQEPSVSFEKNTNLGKVSLEENNLEDVLNVDESVHSSQNLSRDVDPENTGVLREEIIPNKSPINPQDPEIRRKCLEAAINRNLKQEETSAKEIF